MTNFSHELWQIELLRKAIEAGTANYGNAIMSQHESALPSLTGDGMAWHNAFVRGVAESVARSVARRGRKEHITWLANRKELEGFKLLGDYVAFAPVKGQNRFSLRLAGKQYLLLPASGSITQNILTLSSMGKMRQEFLINQMEDIPKNPYWSFEHILGPINRMPNQMLFPNTNELRVLIVTNVYGTRKERIKVWLAIPDGRFNFHLGIVSLAESDIVLDTTIQELLSSQPRKELSKRMRPNQTIGMSISRKIIHPSSPNLDVNSG